MGLVQPACVETLLLPVTWDGAQLVAAAVLQIAEIEPGTPEPHPERKKYVPSGNSWNFMKTQGISGGTYEMFTYMFTYTYTRTHTYTYSHSCLNEDIYIYTYTYIYLHTYIYIYICVCVSDQRKFRSLYFRVADIPELRWEWDDLRVSWDEGEMISVWVDLRLRWS